MIKRILSLILAMALLMTLLPQTLSPTHAEDVYSGECGKDGDNLTWTYDPDTRTLTIEGSGEMADYGYSKAPWKSYGSELTKLVLPEGLTHIGNCAFYNCNRITAVSFPESLSSIGSAAFEGCRRLGKLTFPQALTAIEGMAFYRCTGLSSVSFPDSLVRIGPNAFAYCSNISNASLPKNLTDFHGSAFCCCTALTAINVDEENPVLHSEGGVLYDKQMHTLLECPAGKSGEFTVPENVSEIGRDSFAGCAGLTAISLQNGVSSIGSNAFMYCSGLTEFTIPDGITVINSGTFLSCVNLSSLTIPDSVTEIGTQAFADCSGLTELQLPSHLTTISWGLFYYCTGLESIVIPEGVTSISEEAFCGCESLTNVTIPEGVTSIENRAFFWCGFTSVSLPASITSIGEKALGWYYDTDTHDEPQIADFVIYGYEDTAAQLYAEENGFTFVSIGTGPDYPSGSCGKNGDNLLWVYNPNTCTLTITGTGEMADYYYLGSQGSPWQNYKDDITAIILSRGVTHIGDFAFYCCSKVTSIVLPEGLLSIGESAFENLTKLPSLSLPSTVIEIENSAFSSCWELTAVDFPESLIRLGSGAFERCIKLNNVLLPKNLVEVVAPFELCSVMTEINVAADNPALASENGVLYNKEKTTLIEYPCAKTGAFTIPASVAVIGNRAFAKCSGLSAVTFQSGLVSIGNSAFTLCSGLTEVILPNGVSTIKNSAFSSCDNLRSVTLPDSVTTVESFAFSSCPALEEVRLSANLTVISQSLFASCKALQSVEIPAGVKTISQNAFSGCKALTSAAFPDGLTSIGSKAFYGCDALKSVTVPASVTSISAKALGWHNEYAKADVVYDDFVIYGHEGTAAQTYAESNGITFIPLDPEPEYPSGVCGKEGDNLTWVFNSDTGLLTISGSGEMADYDMASPPWNSFRGEITALSLPEGMTTIGDFAFDECTGLTRVEIPASVTHIRMSGFSTCSQLAEIIIRNPDCLVMHRKEDHLFNNNGPEAGTTQYPDRSLGPKAKVLVYCPHDPVKANSPEVLVQWTEYYDFGRSEITEAYLYAEAYAMQYGYILSDLGAFSDVPETSYYAVPVAWAMEKGITTGTGSGSFSPNKACTREQIVTFLWRAYGSQEPTDTSSPFTDVKPGGYYELPVCWAYHHNPQIVAGVSEERFGVGQSATRGQTATFLWTAAGKPEPTISENPFTDVQTTDYYYKAVLWAAEQGITSGTTPTTFSPEKICTRAQAVTFLYRMKEDLP